MWSQQGSITILLGSIHPSMHMPLSLTPITAKPITRLLASRRHFWWSP